MNAELVATLISGGGLAVSLLGTAFIAGRRDQRINDHERRITALEALPEKIANIDTSMTVISHDLAEIKGMFKLTMKEPFT